MAFKHLTPLAGLQGINVASDTAQHALGMIVGATDGIFGFGEFIYLKGVGSTTVGSFVTFTLDDCGTALLVASATGPVAIAMSASVANQFGWYQITGKAVGKALTAFADDGLVYATATAGSIDDEVVAGDIVLGALGASALGTITLHDRTTLANGAEFELTRPSIA